MRHEWHRELVPYHKLTRTLRALEDLGWEIYSIFFDDVYYHVICRKEQSNAQ